MSFLRFGLKLGNLSTSSLRTSASRSPQTSRLSLSAQQPTRLNLLRVGALRFASTGPTKQNDNAKPTSGNGVSHHTERSKETIQPSLTWNQFFQLRKRRRMVGFVTSIFTALTASSLAFQYFANLVIDFNQMFMGIEMQWIYSGGIIISGFLGWLAGPFVGNQIFNIMIGSKHALFIQMDNVFSRHVARNRPNPTKHNVNTNPLPDYYGEKIGSLHDYRQWLREGRLFAKKAENFF